MNSPTEKAVELALRIPEGGTTPPLARKRKEDWRIYLHLIGGFSHK
jgi:hypothetical protein